MKQHQPKDRVIVISGTYKGRLAEYVKSCSSVFPEYCRIKLDLKGREREQKIVMVLKKEIQSDENYTN